MMSFDLKDQVTAAVELTKHVLPQEKLASLSNEQAVEETWKVFASFAEKLKAGRFKP